MRQVVDVDTGAVVQELDYDVWGVVTRDTNPGFQPFDTFWATHDVVLKDGMVYDALTGPEGLPTDAYKALWEYSDVINFGF